MAHDSVRGEVVDVALALLLVRVAENRTGETWGKLRRYLERMQLWEFSGPAGHVLRPSR